MKVIDGGLLNRVSAMAKCSPRLRMNYNFHSSLEDSLHRLLNAMEPGTYVRPHRHLNPRRVEACILLRGRAAVFIFDDTGCIMEHFIVCPREGVFGMDIEAGVWHSVVVLEENSVFYEVKEGPFVPLSEEDMAPWSPSPDDKDGVQVFMHRLLDLVV